MPAVEFRKGEGAKVQARDGSECPVRTHQQFVQVVAGNIFHHAAAAFAALAAAVDKFGANQEIACSAVLEAQYGVDTRGDCAADGCAFAARDGQREELVLCGKDFRQLMQRQARVHTHCQVRGIVMSHLAETSHVQRQVIVAWGHTHFQFASRPAADQRQLLRCRKARRFRNFFSGLWFQHGERCAPRDGKGLQFVF